MTTSGADTDATSPTARPGLLRHAGRATALALVGSVAINLAIYGMARVAGADMLVPESPGSDAVERLEPVAVVVASILPVLFAAILAIGLGRWVPSSGARIFRIVVMVGLAISFVPFLASEFSTGTALALAIMHPTVAVIALVLLRPVAAGEAG